MWCIGHSGGVGGPGNGTWLGRTCELQNWAHCPGVRLLRRPAKDVLKCNIQCTVNRVDVQRKLDPGFGPGGSKGPCTFGFGSTDLLYVDIAPVYAINRDINPPGTSANVQASPRWTQRTSSGKRLESMETQTDPTSMPQEVWVWNAVSNGVAQHSNKLTFDALTSTEFCMRVLSASSNWWNGETPSESVAEARFRPDEDIVPAVGHRGSLALPLVRDSRVCGTVTLTVHLQCDMQAIGRNALPPRHLSAPDEVRVEDGETDYAMKVRKFQLEPATSSISRPVDSRPHGGQVGMGGMLAPAQTGFAAQPAERQYAATMYSNIPSHTPTPISSQAAPPFREQSDYNGETPSVQYFSAGNAQGQYYNGVQQQVSPQQAAQQQVQAAAPHQDRLLSDFERRIANGEELPAGMGMAGGGPGSLNGPVEGDLMQQHSSMQTQPGDRYGNGQYNADLLDKETQSQARNKRAQPAALMQVQNLDGARTPLPPPRGGSLEQAAAPMSSWGAPPEAPSTGGRSKGPGGPGVMMGR